VRVRVPDLRRVEALPRRSDQFVPEQMPGDADAAGIPEPLLGPEIPGGDSRGAGRSGTAENEMPSFQAGQFLM
jgi:hypothetical protein